jgi:phosphoglycerol transferase MdoB-like AlkP superfamily enzyme
LNRIFVFFKVVFLFLLSFELSRLYFLIYLKDQLGDRFINVWAMSTYSGFALDISTVMYCVAPLILLMFAEGIARKRWPNWFYLFFILLDLVCIFAITISDPELYRQWGSKFNNQVLVYISHPKEMAISTGAVHWGKTVVFAIVLSISLFIIGRLIYKIIQKERTYSIQYTMTELILLVVSFVLLRGGTGVTTISQSSAIYSENRLHNAASINSLWNALYYIFNDVESLYDDKFKVAESSQATKDFRNQIGEDTALFDLTSTSRPNILIVTLESFTASGSMLLEGYNDCMPNLDKIACENLYFSQCYSSGDRTEKGLVSILSGYPAQPLSSIIVFPDKMSALPGLGKELKKEGYKGYFYYGGDADFASMKAYLVVQGIDNIVDKKSLDKSWLTSKWGAHDGFIYSRFLSDAKNFKEPFLANVLSLSSHEPYDVPYSSSDLEKDEWYPYKNSLRYADSCLADFLEQCKKQYWYKNTLIVLVADHGHEIGLKDKLFFGKEKYHIPLVVTGGALQDFWRGKMLNQVVSQTIIPSLLLKSMEMSDEGFRWQTGVYNKHPFAQYHYNNGFGRVENSSSCLKDNLSDQYNFFGISSDNLRIQKDGKIFQQVLVEDFMKK